MASDFSSSNAVSARLVPVWRAQAPNDHATTGEKAGAKPVADAAEPTAELVPAEVRVEIDRASGRFVHTLLDAETQEVLLRYPSEGQLVFSRAISAYMRATSGR